MELTFLMLITDGTSWGTVSSVYSSIATCTDAMSNISKDLIEMSYTAYCVPDQVVNFDILKKY